MSSDNLKSILNTITLKNTIVGSYKPTVGILLPARGRPAHVSKTLRSLAHCECAELMEVVVVADDDREIYRVCDTFPFKSNFADFKLHLSERLMPVRAFNRALDMCESFMFTWMNDENLYQKMWLANALRRFMDEFPDGVGVLSLYKKKKAGLGMSSRAFVAYNEGDWFYPGYTVYYPDDELTCRAILLGRYAFSPDSGVFHDIQVTTEIPVIPAEEKMAWKKKDRSIFYQRTEVDFNLPPEKIHKWTGFKEINVPIKNVSS